ncbi:MAG: hypothetical protein DWQ01_10440 [Planctomycetota bacterium]|nr:MAG: hypothetical protein DWQ01_10440 [Planctomycetota bacterium]
MHSPRFLAAAIVAGTFLLTSSSLTAQDEGLGKRVEEVERRLDLLAEEQENQRLGQAATVTPTEAVPGFGLAASRVYFTEQGVSLGGYGEAVYQKYSNRDDGKPSGKTDTADFLRAILYAGYKFDEHWLFNSEIEFEHASTGKKGEASVEFAYLEYQNCDTLGFRGGLLLVPMGFLNEWHEPTTFFSVNRPGVEKYIMPTTWRENGLGVFGEAGDFQYRSYVLAGFDGSGFGDGGFRGGRQKGSKSKAEDFAWVGRVDWTGVPGLLIGASLYGGNSGQSAANPRGGDLDVPTRIAEAHLEWHFEGFRFRALATDARVGESAQLNRSLGLGRMDGVAQEMRGAYAELGYDLLSAISPGSEASLTPFVRWETVDTQAGMAGAYLPDPAKDMDILTLGVAWQPMDQVVFKLDFQNVDNQAGSGIDQINFALGYIF